MRSIVSGTSIIVLLIAAEHSSIRHGAGRQIDRDQASGGAVADADHVLAEHTHELRPRLRRSALAQRDDGETLSTAVLYPEEYDCTLGRGSPITHFIC